MMQRSHIVSAVGGVLRIFTFLMLIPAVVALLMEPWDMRLLGLVPFPRNALVFMAASLAGFALWMPIKWATREVEEDGLQEREAYLSVGVGWIILVLLGMIPFLLSGEIPHVADAFFESMSGLTATGATVLAGRLEDVAPSVMFWRAGLQYIGGMGIIVLSVALLARLTHGGALLVAAEVSGPGVQRIRPRLKETAKTLWAIYGVLSAAAFVALFLVMKFHAGLGWGDAVWDAIIHTFTMMSTAGFSNHGSSIAYYDSWLLEMIIIVFVLIAGTNFALHFHVSKGRWKTLLRDAEWRFFIGIWLMSTLAVTGLLARAGHGVWEALRGAAFTTASIGTSLGYVTVDYDQWPGAAKLMLILLMFTGASAGSTSGGMKVLRILLLWKVLSRQLRRLLHPRAILPVRVRGKVVPEDSLLNVTAFLFSFLTVWLVGAGILIATDPLLNTFDGAVAAASAIGNTGPAMGVVGPTDNFAALQPLSKVVMAVLMWVGRLEVFTALILFVPRAWARG